MSVKQRLKSIIKDNIAFKKTGNLARGALSHKGLYKVGFSNRVFEKKTLEASKDYNFLFLMDCSGSMTGRNNCMKQSLDALRSFVEMFKDLGRVGIYGFNCELHRVHPLGKKINSKKYMEEICLELHAQAAQREHPRPNYVSGNKYSPESNTYYQGPAKLPISKRYFEDIHRDRFLKGNHDGYLFQKLIPEIKSHKGETICIVISDGWPHCDHGSGCNSKGCGNDAFMQKELRIAIREFEKNKVKLMAIGVDSNGVKDYYKHFRVTNNQGIENSMLSLMKQQFRRGS